MVAAGTVVAGGFALSVMAQAIKGLYQIVGAVNDYIDEHIATLKQSPNPTIACTGRVLEAARYGFGLGYMTSIAVIAVGQVLMGNTFAAGGTVVTGALLINPVAMTCAAVGAIYYGWNALTDKERAEILERLTAGLEMGVELIRSLIDFVIRTTKELLNSKQLVEFKEFIKTQAAQFGKSLYDITHKVGDLAKGAAEKAGELAERAFEVTTLAMKDGADTAWAAGTAASTATAGAAKRTGRAASGAVDATVSATKRALRRKSTETRSLEPLSPTPPTPTRD